MDNASSHISSKSLKFMYNNNISYQLISAGMTPECQPLDISVNKIFKDNATLLFEHDRLFIDKLNPKIRLNTARTNLVDYIYRVWEEEKILTKVEIIKGFRYAGIIGNPYKSKDEEKNNTGYLFWHIWYG